MKLNCVVTIFVGLVLMLATPVFGDAGPTVSSNTQLKTEPTDNPIKFGINASLSRSTSLVDFKDGTRSDGQDFMIIPSATFSFGKLTAAFAYSQNLRDPYSTTENDFADIPVTISFKSIPLDWSKTRNTRFSYSTTLVLPISQLSTKKDDLKTALSAKVSLTNSPKEDDGFTAGASFSVGRNIHGYEEDINGSVLNQYSSNQALSLGYSLGNWSLGIDFINKTRLTYKNSIKSAFELSEELGYSINRNLALALGHTNAGSTLKPNGVDSNLNLINENNSLVYMTLNLSYE